MESAFSGVSARVYPAREKPRALVCAIVDEGEADGLRDAWHSDRAALLCVSCANWNRDLSPWPAPACFRGGGAFSGGAPAFLRALTDEALPWARAETGAADVPCAVCGYSLAGLFALYALLNANAFQMAASVSGSLWFDGFPEYVKTRASLAAHARIYLSLGDREEFTKNPRLARVGEATRAVFSTLQTAGADARLEMNPGNHFFEPAARMARALRWLLP